MVTLDDVEAAARRIAGQIRTTPVLEIAPGEWGLPAGGAFKLEFLQRTGSFKARGALNHLLQGVLPSAGVVAASGGNHAAAVAYAAARRKVACRIYMPGTAPAAKVDRVRALGAEVVLVGSAYADAREAAHAFAVETGARDVPAYDDRHVVAGQGTCAREFVQQTRFDTLIVAVGGGGLAAGCCAALDGRARLVAVETEGTPTLHEALAHGGPVDVDVSGVAADALGARRIGDVPFAVLKDRVAASVVIDDGAVLAARRQLWDDCRIALEPGGAAAFAAVTSGAYRPAATERVGIVLCGANVDPATVTA